VQKNFVPNKKGDVGGSHAKAYVTDQENNNKSRTAIT
jgi:hypothetical protein